MAERSIVDDKPNQSKYWSGLTSTDTGEAVAVPNGVLAGSVQLIDEGSFSGTIHVEGSLDGGTTWGILDDVTNTAMSLTAEDIVHFAAVVSLIRVRADTVSGAAQVRIKFRT